MKIVENPKSGLNSIDLIDNNGVFLRITAESVIDVQYDDRKDEDYMKISLGYPLTFSSMCSRNLSLSVRFLNQVLDLRFVGYEAEAIAESLQ